MYPSPSLCRAVRRTAALAAVCFAPHAQAAPPAAAPTEKDFVRDTGFTYGAWRSCIIGGGGYLQNVVPCPTNPRRFYAYVDVGGIFRSDDGGKNWRMLHGHLPARGGNNNLRGLVVDPRDDKKIMVATGGAYGPKEGVYLSDDAGETWTKTLDAYFDGNAGNRPSGFILTRHPKNPDVVVAASYLDGTFRTEDNGRTWHHTEGADGLSPNDVRFDLSDANHLWLSAGGGKVKQQQCQAGFYRSADGGAHWEKVSSEGEGSPSEIVQDPLDPKRIYGLFGGVGVKLSQDGGATWADWSDGLTLDPAKGKQASISATGYRALTAGPDYVLTANTKNSDFFRLKSGGSTWEKVPKEHVEWGDWFLGKRPGARSYVFGSALGSITVDPHDANHWFCTDFFAIYQTFDAGKNWRLTNDGIEVTVIHSLAQDPAHPAVVHLGMADCGPFVSDDGGKRFEPCEGATDNSKCIALSRQDPARVYSVGPEKQGWESNRVFVSGDRGHHWTRATDSGLPDMKVHHCNSIAADPRDAGTVYLAVSKAVAAGGGGVYRSRDGGKAWEWFGQGLPEGQEFFHHEIWTVGRELAVGGGGGLVALSLDGKGVYYHGPDPGSPWTRTETALGKPWSVVAIPGKTDRFLLGSDNGAMLSEDGGKSWRRVYDKSVHHVTADEANPARLAAGTAAGVVLSEDGGKSWRTLDTELPNRVYNLVAFAGDRLLAGSGGNGAFWLTLPPAPAPVAAR